ncbi:MAG: histidine kinase [Flavobacteriales bacterium]|nr:histidine kinase [Flavobacteriales bacterium]
MRLAKYILVLILIAMMQFEANSNTREALKESFEYIQQAKNDSLRIRGYNMAGFYFADVSIDTALIYADSAIALALDMNWMPGYYYALTTRCNALTRAGRFSESLLSHNEILNFFEEIQDSSKIGRVLANIGELYFLRNDFEKAIAFYRKSLYVKRRAKDYPEMIMSSIYGYVIAMNELGRIEETYSLIQEADTMNLKPTDVRSLCFKYEMFGLYYLDLGEVKKALKYFQDAKYLAVDLLIHGMEARFRYLIAKSFLLLNKPTFAHKEILQSIALFKRTGADKELMDAYQLNSQILGALNRFKSAFNSYHDYTEIRDSIFDAKREEKLVEIETKYSAQQNDYKLNILRQESDIQGFKLYRKNSAIIILLLFSLSIVLIFVIINQSIKNKREKRFRDLEDMILRNQMNPHFIFNALNSIQRFYLDNDSKSGNAFLLKFEELILQIIRFSKERNISLKDEIDLLNNYIALERIRTSKKFVYEFSYDHGIDLEKTFVPPMIFQPYIENAIWHGIQPIDRKGIIKLDIQKMNGLLQCSIIDNGTGLKTQNKNPDHYSQGLKISQSRLGKRGKVEISNRKNQEDETGVIVNLLIPIKSFKE